MANQQLISSQSPPSNNDNPNDIANLVRNWIHYNNMSSSFYKQTLNARKIRMEYENKIHDNLTKNKLQNAIIQVNGGRLGLVEEKNPASLNMAKIEELLHAFYRKNNQIDQTSKIMDFIKENRGINTNIRLRYLDV